MAIASAKITLLATAGTAFVGWVDFVTGTEIRVFMLYLLPLSYAAWYGNRTLTIFIGVLATAVWMASLYFGGRHYSSAYIWLVNFLTQGSGLVAVALILSKLHETLEKERALSRSDGLTGLANSRYFFEVAPNTLALCSRHEWPVTLAYVDLDNFKSANDTKGHQFGDELLKKVAETLKKNLRKSDIAARIGGDEFVILLPESSDQDAYTALEKIRASLELSPEFQQCSVTVSIGAVTYAKPPQDLKDIIKAADNLMYEVKKSSKNQVQVIQANN